ncbi:MAG: IS200/IS605 family transposase [Chitinophagales bacterium]
MPQSFNRIWIHALWGTKDRQPLIEPAAEHEIYDLMRKEFIEIGCPVRIINGMPDHVHSLFLLNPQKSIADVIKQVKGGSSHSINEQNLIRQKFSWQGGYAAYSVSESQLEKVFQYIANQKNHHKKQTFLQEYEEFVALHTVE